jgi:hypothetical protein
MVNICKSRPPNHPTMSGSSTLVHFLRHVTFPPDPHLLPQRSSHARRARLTARSTPLPWPQASRGTLSSPPRCFPHTFASAPPPTPGHCSTQCRKGPSSAGARSSQDTRRVACPRGDATGSQRRGAERDHLERAGLRAQPERTRSGRSCGARQDAH